jgi:hypothetical protein
VGAVSVAENPTGLMKPFTHAIGGTRMGHNPDTGDRRGFSVMIAYKMKTHQRICRVVKKDYLQIVSLLLLGGFVA